MESRTTAIPECRIRDTGLRLKDVRTFQRTGALILRNVIDPAELSVLDRSASALIEWAWKTGRHPDITWSDGPEKPGAAPIRIEYVVDKSRQILELAGNPMLLGVMEAIVGPNLVPTWDSMVFKVEQGAPGIAWHRDGQMYDHAVAVTGPGRVVDVGIYLDPASPDNGVWALPGSNYWSDEKADAALASLNADGWATFYLAVLMQARRLTDG
jgi:phytanoyl-CoA hydroxylase